MTHQEKRIEQIKQNPARVRFTQLQWLLFSMGFVRYRQRGSHITYHHKDGRIIFIPKPHGHRTFFPPSVVKRILKALEI